MNDRPDLGDFDATVRTALNQVAAATHEAPDLADRLLANARSGGPSVVSLSGHRRATRWTLPLLAAAAVVAVTVGAVVATESLAGHKVAPGHSSSVPLPSLTSPAPTSTAAPSSSPSSKHASTKTSGTHTKAVPPGLRVPKGFTAADSSFLDTSRGWALGDGKCAASSKTDCAVLIATTDGGASWRAVSVPPGVTSTFEFGSCGDNGGIVGPCVNEVQFANASDGYLWSRHEFYWTSDGGHSWSRENNPASGSKGNLGLVFVGGNAVRLSPIAQCSAGCAGTIETAPLGSDHFVRTTPTGVHVGLYTSSLVVRGGAVYLFSGFTADAAGAGILRSDDSGRTWHVLAAQPCGRASSPQDDPFAGGNVADNGDVIAICNGTHPGIRVAAAGTTAFSPLRPFPGNGDLTTVVAASTGRSMLAFRDNDRPKRGVLYSTTDGGQNWTKVSTLSSLSGSLRFRSPTSGYATAADGKSVYVTTDGGQTWSTQSFA